LLERYPEKAGRQAATISTDEAGPGEKIHRLWLLHRTGTLSDEHLAEALEDSSIDVRQQACRIMQAMTTAPSYPVINQALGNPDALVRRAALAAAAAHPSTHLIDPLFALVETTGIKADPQLHYAARLALRNHLTNEDLFKEVTGTPLTNDRINLLMRLAPAVNSDAAGDFVARNLHAYDGEEGQLATLLQFSARSAPVDALDSMVPVVRSRFDGDPAFQAELLASLHRGVSQTGRTTPPLLKAWANDLATGLLEKEAGSDPKIGWNSIPHGNDNQAMANWTHSSKRHSADGEKHSRLWRSFPSGETTTGIYRSQSFDLPSRLRFFVAGHDGPPEEAPRKNNLVRLRHSLSHLILQEAAPPRNDTAAEINWDTSKHAGQPVYLEIVDRDPGNAFAWIAAGRFSLPGLNPQKNLKTQRLVAELIVRFHLKGLIPAVTTLLENHPHRTDLARALAELQNDSHLSALAEATALSSLTPSERMTIIKALAGREPSAVKEMINQVLSKADGRQQRLIAKPLASTPDGIETLLGLVDKGTASPRLLQHASLAPTIA
ncbi:MAG: HEAT repeat domain-containing protein, partial [Verrucomicrobiota bacterium]